MEEKKIKLKLKPAKKRRQASKRANVREMLHAPYCIPIYSCAIDTFTHTTHEPINNQEKKISGLLTHTEQTTQYSHTHTEHKHETADSRVHTNKKPNWSVVDKKKKTHNNDNRVQANDEEQKPKTTTTTPSSPTKSPYEPAIAFIEKRE